MNIHGAVQAIGYALLVLPEGGNATVLTNMLTGERMNVVPHEEGLKHDMLSGRYVIDDSDYAKIAQGLTDEWHEKFVCFNVENVSETYNFAKRLFNKIVDSSNDKVEIFDDYDPVRKILSDEAGEEYMFEDKNLEANGYEHIDYDKRDSSIFRLYWKYMPQFRVLERGDFIKTMAVFMMLFIFIAIICFAAVIIIAYTRCRTIALQNARVYDDLRHLGAPNAYLAGVARIFCAFCCRYGAHIRLFSAYHVF